MAYKFQLGNAVLSGSLTQKEGLNAGDDGLANAGAIAGATTIDASGDLTVGTITMSEFTVAANGNTDIDGTLNVEGIPTFQAGAVFSSGITTAGAIGGATTFSGSSYISASNIVLIDATSIAGDGVEDNGSGALQVKAAQTTITSLFATDIKIGEDDQTKIDFEDENKINFYVNNVKDVVLEENVFGPGADSEVDLGKTGTRWKDLYVDSATITNNVTIGGNLTVQGTQTFITSSTLVVSSSIQFEGTIGDGFQIELTTANPGADRTITLPDLTGHVPLLAGAVSNANVTAAEFALLDGGSTVVTATVADGDAVLFNDADDTMKHINVTSLKTYFQTGVTATTAQGFAFNQYGTGSAAQDMNGATGFWAVNSDNGESANAVTLDLSGSWSNGNVVIIKGYNNIDKDSRPMTIRAVGDDTVEGEAGITLESDSAAVTLVYGGGNWNIV